MLVNASSASAINLADSRFQATVSAEILATVTSQTPLYNATTGTTVTTMTLDEPVQ